MSSLLRLESEEVRMVGIWGSSGIGKTSIARALFSRVSRHFQGSVFIDSAFVSKCSKNYHTANPDDYNMKLHLQVTFLSEIFGKRDIKMDHIGAMGERLKHQKILIVLDDLDDQVVLVALAGRTQWFGRGSRIIAITKDKHLLRAHGINYIYKVGLPSEKQALQMFCRSAFRQDSPPDGFVGLASEVEKRAGSLPLGLNVLGSCLRGRNKEDWMDMLPRLRNKLDGKIEKTLRVSYDGLGCKEDKALFRHIACLFNGAEIGYIKLILADSDLDVNIGLKNLVDKSLIHVRGDSVEMHCLVQEMGKEIVRTQSNEPGEREFLLDCKDICDVLEDNTGTKTVLGILLDMSGIDELNIHKRAFEKMRNLFFLKINKKPYKEVRWHIPEGFNYLPPKLKILSWKGYPLKCLPSKFCPQHLVKLKMQKSKLEKLWEGVHPLTGLKRMDLSESKNLKEIPDLSMATNLEKLLLRRCSSLAEITSSIGHLHKLLVLDMSWCTKLETLPLGINLKSLNRLDLGGCSRLRRFPDISSNISWLDLSRTTIEKFPSILRLENLSTLQMKEIKSRKLWEGVQPLTFLTKIDLSGSEKLEEIPDFSLATNLEWMHLRGCSSLVELPSSSIQNLNKLTYLSMEDCIKLEKLPTGIDLESLDCLNLSGCLRLRTFPDISFKIFLLILNQTAIEEIPWWIKKFYRLKCLRAKECKKLKYVSSVINRMKHLKEVDFSNSKFTYKGTVLRTDAIIQPWQWEPYLFEAWQEPQDVSHQPRKIKLRELLHHVMKISTDAAWREDIKVAGLSWTFTNFAARIHSNNTKVAEFVSSPLVAEGLAMLAALKHTAEMGIKTIVVESYSLQLIQILNNRIPVPEIDGILADIFMLAEEFQFISFFFVPRSAKSVADSLARKVLRELSRFLDAKKEFLDANKEFIDW